MLQLRAARDVAAVVALDERRVAAAIEQQDALLAALQSLAERVLERLAEHEAKRHVAMDPPAASPLAGRCVCRRSTTSTLGSRAAPTRSGSVSSVYFPDAAFSQLSRLGVALPSTTTAPSVRARTIATSRA